MCKARDLRRSAVATMAMSVVTLPVFGQSNAPVLEEVIVVAQKREQSLQDVPISLAVLDSNMLSTRGIDNLTDIGANVPNLFVNPVNNTPTSVRLFVRGIGQGDVQLTQDPSVALYLDGVYIGTTIGAGFDGVDVERIEILRGPQGTLYGRNATGGALNIITRRANTQALEFRQDLTGGNLGIFKANTVANVPITDSMAIKLNYFHNERDELTSNGGPGEDFGLRDNDSVVADLRWDASADLRFDYRYEKAWSDTTQRLEQVTQFEPGALSSFTEVTQVSSDRLDDVDTFRDIVKNDLEIDGHSLVTNWNMNAATTLKSITAWRELDNIYFSDPLATSVGDYTALGRGVGAPSYAVFATEFEQFSQEFQLIGSADSLEYVVGFYYYEDDSELDGDGSLQLGVPVPVNFTSAENESVAVFGQLTWIPSVMDRRWQITVGARYSEDERKAFRDNGTAGFSGNYDNDFDNFTPALTVGFDASDAVNVYGKVVTGFRSGGTSQRSANATLFSEGFDEEEIINYELGVKGEFWDRRARVNAAVFYMDIDGLQTSVQTGATPGQRDFFPIDNNEITGLEIDMTFLLTDQLRARLDYGYLDAQFGESETVTAIGTFALVDTLTYAPDHSLALSLDYGVQVDNGSLDFNLNYAYRDEVNTAPLADQVTVLDDYDLWGAAITWSDIDLGQSIPGNLQVMLWGKNLADEEYGIISAAAWSLFGASEVTTFGDPRTYGLTLSYIY